jgi:hypothetical protein
VQGEVPVRVLLEPRVFLAVMRVDVSVLVRVDVFVVVRPLEAMAEAMRMESAAGTRESERR